jgi:mono/diheme cytochrome c family protein
MKIRSSIVIPLVALLALTPQLVKADGAQVYGDNCASCHQPDGSGVAGSYPALKGQPILAGDADTIIKIILLGPAKVLPADGPKYTGQMPPFTSLSDSKIAAVVTYIRDKFGNGASAVDEDEVTKVKASLSQ